MKSLDELKALREKTKKRLDLRDGESDYRIVVGMGTCGIAAGARQVLNDFVSDVAKYNASATVIQAGCNGMCIYEPLVEVFDKDGNKTTYVHLNAEKVDKIVKNHLVEGKICEEYTIGAVKR